MSFTNLHVHSVYSILDGAIRFPGLVERLQELGMTACALTDHGFMGGLLEFQKEMEKASLHPILGVEAYITADQDNSEERNRDNLHAVLLAKDNEGLRKLMYLQGEAATQNFYYKPRIYLPKLFQLSGHVVVTTACLKGLLSPFMIRDEDDFGIVHSIRPIEGMDRRIRWLKDSFGDDLYLETQAWDDETHIQKCYNELIVELSRKYNIKTVITSDCHYLTREDHTYHELMMALQLGKTYDEYLAGDVMKYGNFFYVHTPEEMKQAASSIGCPEAIENTLEVTEKCQARIETGTYHLPTYKPEKASDYEDFQKHSQQY